MKSEKHKLNYDDIDLFVGHFWSVTLRSYDKLLYYNTTSTKDKTATCPNHNPQVRQRRREREREKKINGLKIYSYVRAVVCEVHSSEMFLPLREEFRTKIALLTSVPFVTATLRYFRNILSYRKNKV